jgi:hypothetical protein
MSLRSFDSDANEKYNLLESKARMEEMSKSVVTIEGCFNFRG